MTVPLEPRRDEALQPAILIHDDPLPSPHRRQIIPRNGDAMKEHTAGAFLCFLSERVLKRGEDCRRFKVSDYATQKISNTEGREQVVRTTVPLYRYTGPEKRLRKLVAGATRNDEGGAAENTGHSISEKRRTCKSRALDFTDQKRATSHRTAAVNHHTLISFNSPQLKSAYKTNRAVCFPRE